MVSIQYYSSSSVATGIHFCAGTIISPLHIVTASHCDIGVTLDKLRIIAGNSNNQCTASSTSCTIRKVTKFTRHPSYDSSTIKNDIAIIELDQPIPLDGVRAVAAKIENLTLDQFLSSSTSSMVNIAGWGRTTTQSSVQVIQKAMVPVSPISVCNAKNLGVSSPNQICAGNGNGVDTCGGDSGGPLFRIIAAGTANNNLPIFVLTGVVSYGPPGCGGSNVGAYTNATQYISFIRDQVGSSYTVEKYGDSSKPITPTPVPTPSPVTPVVPVPSNNNQSCKCKCYCKKVRQMREMRLRGGNNVDESQFMKWIKLNPFKAL
ncbi:predicted protein [Naegleria gruberi]|uniref:Predicted protein n=1 Tax=Naegleria gruberi TaxID=5762 RepID=D2V3L9_NAEGR|nr:uncharacterized protein NAEGRDRAFT_46418 [Naegleria gruberi]EFC48660.1 predicted protein [Naegleria gruberi]|eukprot:XP_002681404.1 predicted protein [Naegleria gruberi strain NEG-M]